VRGREIEREREREVDSVSRAIRSVQGARAHLIPYTWAHLADWCRAVLCVLLPARALLHKFARVPVERNYINYNRIHS